MLTFDRLMDVGVGRCFERAALTRWRWKALTSYRHVMRLIDFRFTRLAMPSDSSASCPWKHEFNNLSLLVIYPARIATNDCTAIDAYSMPRLFLCRVSHAFAKRTCGGAVEDRARRISIVNSYTLRQVYGPRASTTRRMWSLAPSEEAHSTTV